MSYVKLNIAHFLAFILLIVFYSSYSQPNTINGLSLWLRADSGVVLDNGYHVKQWKDFSSNQFVFLQNDSNLRPKLNNYFNKPSLYFDGTNDYFDGGDILNLGLTGNSIFVIANALNTSGTFLAKSFLGGVSNRYSLLYENNQVLFLYHDINVNLFSYPLDTFFTLWSIWENKQNGIIKILKNSNYLGQLNISSTHDMTSNYNFLIGAYNNSYGTIPPVLFLKGHISEIIMYNRTLTEQERFTVETYLMDKYAPPVRLPADTALQSFCPFTIKPQGYFTQYLWSTGETTDSIVVQTTGYYKVTATDIFGRQSTDSIFVQFPSPWNIDSAIVCFGDSVLITSSLGNLYNYQWSNGSNNSFTYLKDHGWYFVTITDSFNCSKVDSILLQVDSLNITPLFSADSITLCEGNVLSINNLSHYITHYLWQPTGDTIANTTVNNEGWYYVTVKNINQCIRNDSIFVKIAGKVPILQFTNSHTCLGQNTTFISTSYSQDTSQIINTTWILNNNDTIIGSTINYLFENYGFQKVEMQATTSSGCYQFFIDSILVYPLPVVNFNSTGFCERQLTQFFSSSTIPFGQVVDFYWNFGDGNYSIDKDPLHIYQHNGLYQVSFTAISNEGCQNTITKDIEIKYTPFAGFVYGASCVQKQTFFTDTSKTLSYYPIIEWKWDFGNGNFSSQQNPINTYSSVGNYETKLVIKILNGCRDTAISIINVSSSPKANFINDSACIYQLLNAHDISQITNGSIESRKWYIGSSYYSNQPSISIVPYEVGPLPITLIVQSNTNCFDTITKVLNVKPKPQVSFLAEPYYGTVPLTVYFQNTSEQGQFYWYFGDGNISQETNPQHVYTDTGKYNVWLKLINPYGCYDSINKVVLVVPNLIDLSVEDITLQKSSSFIEVFAKITNTGTLPIENPELQLWTNGRFMIAETFYDTLFTGDIVWYKFNGKINLQNINPKYICVQGEVNNSLTEISYNNNSFCKALEDIEQILNFYPNPVFNKFILEYYLNDNQKVSIAIFDMIGKQIYEYQYYAGREYNRTEVDISFLPQGIYNIKFQTQQITFKQVIIKL